MVIDEKRSKIETNCFFAQKDTLLRINYKAYINGSDAGPESFKTVIAGKALSTSEAGISDIRYIPEKPLEKDYIDHSNKVIKQVANLSDGTSIFYETEFNSLPVSSNKTI